METSMRRYSFWLTSALGACALAWLVASWHSAPMLQRLPVVYIVALPIHEGEELRFPGGFVELATSMTGIEIKNLGLAKFGLLCFTVYATAVPALLAGVGMVWPVMSTLLIGVIEVLAHLAAARVNRERFYSPGLVTALAVQLPVACYGFWWLGTQGLIQPVYWLWAALFLLVPLFCLQAAIVRSNGQPWHEFMGGALRAMAGARRGERRA